ncbi:hypothetical protein [Lutibacter sp.]
MKKLLLIIAVGLITQLSYSQEKLTNQSVVDLIDLGFDLDVVKSKINSSIVEFNTSLSELKRLKGLNVPSEILTLMINKSKVIAKAGIFYFKDNHQVPIYPSMFSGSKSSSLGAALTGGIVSAKNKSYVPNTYSNNKVYKQEFTFYFTSNESEVLTKNWWFNTASSPNEFILIELKVKKKKNQRELVTGKVDGLGNAQAGVGGESSIPFRIEKMQDGGFKVTPINVLKPGEYAFIYSGFVPVGGNNNTVFDFSAQ